MPYSLIKKGDKWIVRNKETNEIKGTHDSQEKAKAQIRLLQAIEHGWHPTRQK